MCSSNEDAYDFTPPLKDDMMLCFNTFDKNKIEKLSINEFKKLCYSLFQNGKGNKYLLEDFQAQELFTVFDRNQDGFIDKNEFKFCWNKWIKVIVESKSALLIVDVQNDFISGTLPISEGPANQNAQDIITPINNLLETVKFDVVFYTLDWHPDNHISFIDNVGNREIHESSECMAKNAKTYDSVTFTGPPKVIQTLWPKHCVQDTWGAQLHADLKIVDNGINIYKGTNPEVDSYSAFWDNQRLSETVLNKELQSRGITDVYVCGLAYDICVGATALDSLNYGYRTIIIDDCTKGINLKQIEKIKGTIVRDKGAVVSSKRVENMVKCLDRRCDLGYKLAMELLKL